jgi:hypothetical protein
MGNAPIDGSWFLGIAVAGFSFLCWQQFKSIREDIKEIDSDVKDIRSVQQDQALDIARIKIQLEKTR